MAADDSIEQAHLEWTRKQGYVLTGGGKAETFYTAERGFPFVETDLPHYHLLKGDTHATFKPDLKDLKLPVAGAWSRSLFCGGWKYSSDKEERVYNVQTNNLFIDFRVPRSMEQVFGASKVSSLNELSPRELRLYARQHIFAGFTVLNYENERPVAVRHHFIDWNFVGVPRSRPNKWWIELNCDNSSWKEYSYATNDIGQHYYFEQWDRLENGMPEPRLALRVSPSCKRKVSAEKAEGPSHKEGFLEDDGLFVIAGDHFNYVMNRKHSDKESSYEEARSLVDLVDAAIKNGDEGGLETARSFLSIEGGHGLISNEWKLDCAIPHWNEGKDVTSIGGSPLEVLGSDLLSCKIIWKDRNWDIYDCSFESIEHLKEFLDKSQRVN